MKIHSIASVRWSLALAISLRSMRFNSGNCRFVGQAPKVRTAPSRRDAVTTIESSSRTQNSS
eukprot:8307130-Heterocapsa_arctica.AAC.1